MIGAIVFVHAQNGFFLPTGYEFALLLGTSALALALGGGGTLSADGMIAGRNNTE